MVESSWFEKVARVNQGYSDGQINHCTQKIGQADMTGSLGVNIIERRILEMGFLWYRSGGVEAGIDGRMEIRNEDGEVTNLIISVQSKATDGRFEGETEKEFTFTCSERDLRYWLKGNLPVVLVCARPRTNEAYWLSVKDFFSVRRPAPHASCASLRRRIPSIFPPKTL